MKRFNTNLLHSIVRMKQGARKKERCPRCGSVLVVLRKANSFSKTPLEKPPAMFCERCTYIRVNWKPNEIYPYIEEKTYFSELDFKEYSDD